MRFIIVSLIGIPASGKSAISMKIHKLSKENLLNSNVIVLNFDKLIHIDYANITDGDYKKSREECFVKIENLIEKLKVEVNCKWMHVIESDELNISKNLINLNSENSVTLLIIDDNMYYRSMRQRARQICKRCDCKHFQIFMKCQLNDAIDRNSRRSAVVENSVIEKMFNDLEVPENPRTIIMEIEKIDEQKLIDELRDRIENPETLTEELLHEPQEQSFIHELDLMTRKELSCALRDAKDKENLKELSRKFNCIRKQFMEDIRSGKIKLLNLDEYKIKFRKMLTD